MPPLPSRLAELTLRTSISGEPDEDMRGSKRTGLGFRGLGFRV